LLQQTKGQYSFEVVMLTILILFLASLAASYYFSSADSTAAIAALKPNILSVLGKSANTHHVYDVTVTVPSPDTLEIDVYLIPQTSVAAEQLEPELIEEIEDFSDDIAQIVHYDIVLIRVIYPGGAWNIPPLANIWFEDSHKAKKKGTTFSISGSGSSDEDGSIVWNQWTTNNDAASGGFCTIGNPGIIDTIFCCSDKLPGGEQTFLTLEVRDDGGATDTSNARVKLSGSASPCS